MVSRAADHISNNGGEPVLWSTPLEALATAALLWYVAVVVVSITGYIQLRRWYSTPRPPAACLTLMSPADIPHVTIIRPVKGLEPSLYDCLAATFCQTYPQQKLSIYLCLASRNDPAHHTLQRLLDDFPDFDARILIESDDRLLDDVNVARPPMGPNPKIRNMSRAYREAKGDIVWILDCNVWVSRGVCGRMVDTLCGYGGRTPNKFVHQLPLVVDTTAAPPPHEAFRGLCRVWALGGGRLEEVFMSSSHAKFYTAINTVLVAPCIVGKSNMFRRSHLDDLTGPLPTTAEGIDFFSANICEDQLIGARLWDGRVAAEARGQHWGKHAMCFGDLAIQPMDGMSVPDYIARRVRWLRVRKFTVTLATLVEPGTESLLCALCGAFAFTSLPFLHRALGMAPTWTVFWAFWLVSVTAWCLVDRSLHRMLHSAASIDADELTPAFARPPTALDGMRRSFGEWLIAWLGRELMAWPIWAWAMYGGTSVRWREKRFRIGFDMKVHEIRDAVLESAAGGKVRTE